MREGSHSPVVMLTPRASRSCRKWPRPEPRDPTEDLGEQRSRHRHFGQLEHDVAAVADDSGTDLDQLLEQGGERPLLDVLRQRQRAQEVGETVGERVQLEAYSVVPEGVRSDARSVLAGVRESRPPARAGLYHQVRWHRHRADDRSSGYRDSPGAILGDTDAHEGAVFQFRCRLTERRRHRRSASAILLQGVP